ncbi:Protein of unknown function [Bacillus wiedmannii]
MEGKN